MARSPSDASDTPVGRLRAGLSRLLGGRVEPHDKPGVEFDVPAAPRHARAAIYARSVVDDAGEEISTVADQERRCRTHADSRGYEVVGAFLETEEDPDESRPALRLLRSAIWRREIDVVVATEPERLFYDADRLIRFAREAYSLNIILDFVDGTPSEDLTSDW